MLQPKLTIQREQQYERAARLLEKAERICLISRSLSCTVVLDPKIVVEVPVGAIGANVAGAVCQMILAARRIFRDRPVNASC